MEVAVRYRRVEEWCPPTRYGLISPGVRAAADRQEWAPFRIVSGTMRKGFFCDGVAYQVAGKTAIVCEHVVEIGD